MNSYQKIMKKQIIIIFLNLLKAHIAAEYLSSIGKQIDFFF